MLVSASTGNIPYAKNRIRLEDFLVNHGILKEKNWPNSRCNKSRCTRWSVHSTVPPPLCARLTRFLFAIIGYRLLWPTACSNDQKGTSCAVNKKDGRNEVSAYSRLSQREIAAKEPEGRSGTVLCTLRRKRCDLSKGEFGQVVRRFRFLYIFFCVR